MARRLRSPSKSSIAEEGGVSSRRLPSWDLTTSQAQAATRGGCGGYGCTLCRPARRFSGRLVPGGLQRIPVHGMLVEDSASLCPCVQGVACCVGLCGANATFPSSNHTYSGDGDAAPEWTDWASAAIRSCFHRISRSIEAGGGDSIDTLLLFWTTDIFLLFFFFFFHTALPWLPSPPPKPNHQSHLDHDMFVHPHHPHLVRARLGIDLEAFSVDLTCQLHCQGSMAPPRKAVRGRIPPCY